MAQEVVIEIDEKGNVVVEGKGFAGAECTAVTKALEEAIGTVESRKLKPEYRQARPMVRKAGA